MLRLFLAINLFMLLPGVSTQANDEWIPRFEQSACAFETVNEDIIDCGYLVVPEDRTLPRSPTIRIHVAYIHSYNPAPARDPLIFLEGGPGVEVLQSTDHIIELFEDVLRQRDLILLDQRGVGLSRPTLACPEYADQVLLDLSNGQNLEKAFAGNLAGMAACLERLEENGINVGAYNTRENAADIADLKLALGLERVNLFGVSYGSRLAMSVVRDHPDGIRSVVLDSAYPPSVDYFYERIVNFDAAFDTLFSVCANDTRCNSAYPDLAAIFVEVVDRLNHDPLVVQSYSWLDYEPYAIVFSGDVFIWLMTSLIRSRLGMNLAPRLIYDVYNEDYGAIETNLGAMLGTLNGVSYGMYYSVMCSEATPFSQYGMTAPDRTVSPQVTRFISYQTDFVFGLCQRWQTPALDPDLVAPFQVDIPALVLAGELDPTTPTDWGRIAADMFRPGYLVQFPATGHGVVSAGSCPLQIVSSFLDAPTTKPNTSCIAHMPQLRFVIN